jgi:4-hydroxy-tetrahydrodipicolinate synthase
MMTRFISFGAASSRCCQSSLPRRFADMTRAALNGQFAEASQLLFSLAALNPLMYEESNPVA